jgi:hypothetical protein
MDPLTIAGLITSGAGAVKGLAQTGVGIGQLIGNKRPDEISYQIPDEVKQILQLARIRNSNAFPQGDRYRAQIDTAVANAVGNMNSMAGGSGASLGAMADLYGNQLGSLNQLAIKESEAKLNAERNLTQALGTSGEYQDRSWDMNVRMPYERALAEFFNRRQAGMTNLFGGIDEITGAGNSMMMNEDLMDSLSKLTKV